jgi:hypothetical protein
VLKVIDYAHLDGIFYWYVHNKERSPRASVVVLSNTRWLTVLSVPHSQTHFQQLFLMNGDYKSGFNKAAEGVAVL